MAPIALRALTTSASSTARGSSMSWPGSCLISILVRVVTTVWPCDSGAGWLTSALLPITIERLPCATAQASSVTAWFITIEPVRPLSTTLGACWVGVTSSASSAPRKATRWSCCCGACTWITRPFCAVAVAGPKRRFSASTTRLAVPKSLSLSSSVTVSPCPSSVGTLRSTVAPPLMRPTLR